MCCGGFLECARRRPIVTCIFILLLISLVVGIILILIYEKYETRGGKHSNPELEYVPEYDFIYFNMSREKSYKKYIKQLDAFWEKYLDTRETVECGSDLTNADLSSQSCRVDLEFIDALGCGRDNGFGYKVGKPCVLIALDILEHENWVPDLYDRDELPESVKNYAENAIPVRCTANIRDANVDTYPQNSGFETKYFPYKETMKHYQEPFIMVHIRNPPMDGRTVKIHCQAYAVNLIEEPFVDFELKVTK